MQGTIVMLMAPEWSGLSSQGLRRGLHAVLLQRRLLRWLLRRLLCHRLRHRGRAVVLQRLLLRRL